MKETSKIRKIALVGGGGRDGLHVDRVNRNQGAESSLAFLLSLAEMQLAQNILRSFKEPVALEE
jgi:hypothetical protein